MTTKSKLFSRNSQIKAVQRLCRKAGVPITQEQVRSAIQNYDVVIGEAISRGKTVRTGLGTFSSTVVSGRFYNAPPKAQDQERKWVDAHLKPVCRFRKSLKHSLREIEVEDPKVAEYTEEEDNYNEDDDDEDFE